MAKVELWYLPTMYSKGEPVEDIHNAYREIIAEGKESHDKIMETAIKYNDATAIKMLFDAGYNPNRPDRFDFTMLHELAKAFSPYSDHYKSAPGAITECVNLLLDNKVSVLRKDTNEGLCCYHYAARNANAEFVHALRERNAKLDMTGKGGVTALHELAGSFYSHGGTSGRDPGLVQRYIDTANEFIAAGIDIDAKKDNGWTAGDTVIDYKSVPLFRILVTDPDVFQAIDILAYDDIAELAASNPNAIRHKEYARFDKLSALGAACVTADIRIIETILDAGADINFKNDAGDTAMASLVGVSNPNREALKENHYEKIMDLFAARGWDLNSQIDKDGNTALMVAIKKNFRGGGYNHLTAEGYIIDWLMAHNADVNVKNNMGQTALMFAATNDDDRMENLLLSLLENGADVTVRDATGKTVLHYIAANYSQNLARNMADLILSFGKVDVNAVDNDGKSALDIATENNREELVKFLLSKV